MHIGLCFMLYLLISFNLYELVGTIAVLILYKNKLKLKKLQ